MKALLPLKYILLELLVVIQNLLNSLHIWLAVVGSLVVLLDLVLNFEWILPFFVLHEKAKIDKDQGRRAHDAARTMNKDPLLLVLNHFIEFERSLEQLIVNHAVITVVNRVVDYFGNTVVSVELLQFALVDASCILFFQRLNV